MSKKNNLKNNESISQAVDLLLDNTDDLTTVFKQALKFLTFFCYV